MTDLPDLPDISSDPIEHFRFLHFLAVTGQVDEAAAILLDRFSCDPSEYTDLFRQFIGSCDAAQLRGRGRFDASWAITEADRVRASKGMGVAQHPVTLTRHDDGTITLTTWREAPKTPKPPAPPPPPAPNHSAHFDPVTGERTR